MEASRLPLLDKTESVRAKVENRAGSTCATQEHSSFLLRHREEKSATRLPAITETCSRVLEAGVNTLQKTLVLKKQAELDELNRELELTRGQFKSRSEALAQKRSELELTHQQAKERAMKFERFVAENEMKQRLALNKCENAREQNALKQREIEGRKNELKQLHARKQDLMERIAKFKIYKDFFMKALHYFPSSFLDSGSESSVMAIIQRHETLSITNQKLLQRLGRLQDEVEQGQQQLQTMKQEHSIKTLMANKELSELQSELEILEDKNKQQEDILLMEQGLTRKKAEEVGRLHMAITNLAEQCYLPAYGPLENMNVLAWMDMVKEYIVDMADTGRRARRLMQSEYALTNKRSVTDQRSRGSRKASIVKHK